MPTQPPPAVPLDPALLAAFRQQGAAIMARERGFTPACRAKLVGIARSLGIDESQTDLAIASLTAAEPNAPPNPLAERFRRRLRKDLAGKSQTIIGPTIEAQILAAAARKYGLDDTVAGQVLGEVASELGVTRITASDALQNLSLQIDQAAGDAAWLAREAWDRLRTAGHKWGLELEVVDQLIEQRLAANRDDYLRNSFWTRATLYGAGGAVLAAGVLLAFLWLARSMREEAAVRPGEATTASAPLHATAIMPTWWDVELSVDMAHAKVQLGGLAGVCDLLASANADERATGYERLLEQVRAAPARNEVLTAAASLIAGCHALEPSESALARLRTSLITLLPSSDRPIAEDTAQFNLIFWACDTVASALARRGCSAERAATLADAVGMALGGTLDPAAPRAQRDQSLRQLTVLATYRQFAAVASKQPGPVAKLYAALRQRAAAVLADDELQRAETTLLVAVLPAVGSDWQAFERPLVRCISSPDPLLALRLIDALRHATDPALVEHLTELLVVRSGARPTSPAKKDVIRAVRQALANSGGAELTTADRWLSLAEEAAETLATKPAGSERELLGQIVALTHLTTLAMALAQGEAGQATFDAGIANPPQLEPQPATSETISGLTSLGAARPLLRFTKSQARDFNQYLETFDRHGPAAQAQRESALRGVAMLAEKASDISPQQATALATYVLAEKSPPEQASVFSSLAALKDWKQLRLAIADALLTVKLPLDQQREVAARLLARDLDETHTTARLRHLLLASAVEDLTYSNASSASGGELLDLAAEAIAASYRQRAALVGSAAAAAQTPAEALEVVVGSLTAKSAGRSGDTQADLLPVEQKALRYLATDDLHYTVALQRLLIEASAERVAAQCPQHAAAIRQLAAQTLGAAPAAPTALVQLRDQEAALLKLWMFHAPEA